MKGNRRTYYRILYVQPEAPIEIIKASYRSLMTKLRHHPDLGGDHDTAVLINQAYAVLIDVEKRAAYDRSLRKPMRSEHPETRRTGTAQPQQPYSKPQRQYAASSRSTSTQWDEEVPGQASSGHCNFCRTAVRVVLTTESRCHICESPVAPLSSSLAEVKELFGRRAVPRISKKDPVVLYPVWGLPASSARLRDLSPKGISMSTTVDVRAGQVIKVVASGFEVVATVVSCRSVGDYYSVHARLLSAIFANGAGVFVTTTA